MKLFLVLVLSALWLGCSGIGVGVTKMARSSFTYGSARCGAPVYGRMNTCGGGRWESTGYTFTSRWLVGYLLAANLGGSSGSINDAARAGGMSADLFSELFMGRRGLGGGFRTGYVMASGGDASFGAWHFTPMLYVIPLPYVTLMGGVGRAFAGNVTMGSGSSATSADAGGWRYFAGIRVPVFPFFAGSRWVLDAELGHLGSGEVNGRSFSAMTYTFGGYIAF